mmetsp:Transcript_126680/g.370130  ORF Transcript_126680/g.370130 Transcript_126680/m.370130 type:complete len:465 (+) Transcript_126680:413-1807(+)
MSIGNSKHASFPWPFALDVPLITGLCLVVCKDNRLHCRFRFFACTHLARIAFFTLKLKKRANLFGDILACLLISLQMLVAPGPCCRACHHLLHEVVPVGGHRQHRGGARRAGPDAPEEPREERLAGRLGGVAGLHRRARGEEARRGEEAPAGMEVPGQLHSRVRGGRARAEVQAGALREQPQLRPPAGLRVRGGEGGRHAHGQGHGAEGVRQQPLLQAVPGRLRHAAVVGQELRVAHRLEAVLQLLAGLQARGGNRNHWHTCDGVICPHIEGGAFSGVMLEVVQKWDHRSRGRLIRREWIGLRSAGFDEHKREAEISLQTCRLCEHLFRHPRVWRCCTLEQIFDSLRDGLSHTQHLLMSTWASPQPSNLAVIPIHRVKTQIHTPEEVNVWCEVGVSTQPVLACEPPGKLSFRIKLKTITRHRYPSLPRHRQHRSTFINTCTQLDACLATCDYLYCVDAFTSASH